MPTLLSQPIRDAYKASRPEIPSAEGIYDATVSELIAGDWIIGARAEVVSTGATTSGIRALTITRSGVTMPVNWSATATLRIQR